MVTDCGGAASSIFLDFDAIIFGNIYAFLKVAAPGAFCLLLWRHFREQSYSARQPLAISHLQPNPQKGRGLASRAPGFTTAKFIAPIAATFVLSDLRPFATLIPRRFLYLVVW